LEGEKSRENESMRLKESNIVELLAYLSISLFCLRKLFDDGVFAVQDLSPIYKFEQLYRPMEFPWDHYSNTGVPNVLIGNLLYNLPLMALSKALGSVITAHKIYFVILLTLGAYGQRLVFQRLYRRGGFISGLVYLLNPWTVYRISRGHNLIIMGSALLPFAFISFLSFEKKYRVSRALLSGFLSSLLLLISPHMGYIFFIILFVYGLAKFLNSGLALRNLLKQLVLLCQTGFLALSFGMPVLILAIKGIGSNVTVVRLEETLFYSLSIDLLKERWPYLVIGLGIMLSLFIFVGLVRELLFSILLVFVGMMLSFGGVWPISLLIELFYKHLPGFFIFRELNKFLYMALFGGSLLFEVLILGLKDFTESIIGKRGLLGLKFKKLTGFVFIALALFILIIPDKDMISGDFGGSVKTVKLPSHLKELDRWLRSEKGEYRVAFFPPACWAARYDWSERWFLDPMVSLQAKPTIEIRSEMDITPSNNFVKWVYMALYFNRTNRIGRLLGLLGARYIIYRPDVDMPDERVDLRHLGKEQTIPIFRRKNDLLLIKRIGEYEIYLNKHALPLIVEGFRPVLVVEDRKALISLSHLDLNFSENVCLFLDNLYDYADLEELVKGCRYVIINPKKWIDLQLALSEDKLVIKPWEFVEMSTDASNKWIRGDFSWYLYGGTLNVAPDDYVMTNKSDNSLSLPFTIPRGGNFTLFVQTFTTSSESFGKIYVKIDDYPQESIQIRVSGEIGGYYRWVKVGSFHLTKGKHYVKFRSSEGAASISKIVLLPESEFNKSITIDLSSLPSIALLMDDDFWDVEVPDGFAESPEFSNGRAVYLLNKTVYGSFYIPRGGEYTLVLRAYAREESLIKVYLDDLEYDVVMEKEKQVKIRSLSIEKGTHRIGIKSNHFCLLDLALLVEGAEAPLLGRSEEKPIALNPIHSNRHCSCNLSVNSSHLLFLETYEPGWRLICEKEMEPIQAFSYANLYSIKEMPKGDCTLYFVGCKLIWNGFLIGLALMMASVSSIMIFKKTELMWRET